MSVGIPLIPYRCEIETLSSTLSLTTRDILVLRGDCLDNRAKFSTWSTPGRPEIDHRLLRLQHVCFKAAIRNFFHEFTHDSSPS
jgi:hypothetical protein